MEKVEFTQGILAMESDLHRFAYKLTSDRDSANDLVQDCVLQALDNHEKFAHAKNLKGWMFTIMRNIFVNNYRRTVREMNIIDDTYSINQQSLIEDEDSDIDPETYYVSMVPVSMNIWLFLLINAGTLLTSVLMLVGPSYLITKINPADSMRYE